MIYVYYLILILIFCVNIVYYCNECFIIFESKLEIEQHQIREHGKNKYIIKLYVCHHNGCNKIFNEITKYKRHMESHIKPYKCEHKNCNKYFGTKWDLKIHINGIHNNIKLYKCQYCHKTFKHPSSKRNHINTIHLNKKYPCHICGKILKGKGSLHSHLKLHNNNKLYKCQHCNIGFVFKKELKYHLKMYHP